MILRRHQVYVVAGGLTLAGLGLFLYKAVVLTFPLRPDVKSDIWNIEARIVFEAQNGPVKATLLIPRDTRRFHVLDENFISRGYGLSTVLRDDGNRQAVWSIRKAAGRQTLYYRAAIAPAETKRPLREREPAFVVAAQPTKLKDPELTAARVLGSEVRAQSADIDTMVTELIKRLNSPHRDQNTALLLGKNPTALARMETAVEVLAVAGLPARVAHGIRLEDHERDAPLIHWLQVFNGRLWRSYDPATGQPTAPDDFFAWWRGRDPITRVDGGQRLHVVLSVNRSQERGIHVAAAAGESRHPQMVAFSLFSLPIETQSVYRVVLMIPLGALVLVVLRNVVGIKTFGTFMPVLIALAFRQTQLLWGIFLFSLVVSLGLSVRFYLDRLKLLLVPRLAAVLTVVVLLMAALSVLSHKLGLERGLSVALFPMVIMTMTIERMSIVWDERGPNEALLQGLGSFVAASIAYLVIFRPYLEHLMFVFPELLLVILAVILLLGRYSGYRLTELFRFKVLSKRG